MHDRCTCADGVHVHIDGDGGRCKALSGPERLDLRHMRREPPLHAGLCRVAGLQRAALAPLEVLHRHPRHRSTIRGRLAQAAVVMQLIPSRQRIDVHVRDSSICWMDAVAAGCGKVPTLQYQQHCQQAPALHAAVAQGWPLSSRCTLRLTVL